MFDIDRPMGFGGFFWQNTQNRSQRVMAVQGVILIPMQGVADQCNPLDRTHPPVPRPHETPRT